jgi:Chaperone of endosialidase
MPRNGSGQYILPPGNPVITQTLITSQWANSTMTDLGLALTQSLSRDGQTLPSANLPMAGFRHTGVGNAQQRDQYTSLGMVQDNAYSTLTAVGGSNSIIALLVGGATTFVPGQKVWLTAASNNTGPVTISINGGAATPVVTSTGSPLAANNLIAGRLYDLVWTGTNWAVGGFGSSGAIGGQAPISGWQRPENGVYEAMTVSPGNIVNIPAGTGRIVKPSADDISGYIDVSWPAQSVTITGLTEWSTALGVDENGTVVQFAGSVPVSVLRQYVMLGVAAHTNGVVNSVQNVPGIYGDVSYMARDIASIFRNSLVSGGRLSRGVGALNLEVASGTIWRTGGNRNDINRPNFVDFAAIDPLLFFTVTGTSAVSPTQTSAVPVTQYNPGGLAAVVAIPGGVTTSAIHRIYYVDGSFIFVYGQTTYPDLNTAIASLDSDNSTFIAPGKMHEYTFMGYVIAQRNCVDLANTTTARIISAGNISYALGTSGALSDAPVDGQYYGRRNAAWATVAPLASPVFTGDPQAPTPATADNDTSIATTAFVNNQNYLKKSGGAMTGTLSAIDISMSGSLAVGGQAVVIGSLESASDITGFRFIAGSPAILASANVSGEVLLRPSGPGESAGQVRVTESVFTYNGANVLTSATFNPNTKWDTSAATFAGLTATIATRLTDINSMFGQTTQFFSGQSATGQPLATSGTGFFIPFNTAAAGQFFGTTSGATPQVFWRAGSGSAWGGWVEFWHSGNFNPANFVNTSTDQNIGGNKTFTSFQQRIDTAAGGIWSVSVSGVETAGIRATAGTAIMYGVNAQIALRPNGGGISTGQVLIGTSGDASFSGDILVQKSNAIVGVGITATRNGGITNYGVAGTGDVGLFSEHAAGIVRIRPNGRGSTIGQVTFETTGITSNVGITANQNFVSSTALAVLATTGAGNISLRPNGIGSVTGQLLLTAAGVASAVNFSATSDASMKDEIEYIVTRDRLPDMLRFATWLWKDDGERDLGLIAQDVQKVAPEYVYDNDGILAIDKASLALECVIGLAARVAELEKMVFPLK